MKRLCAPAGLPLLVLIVPLLLGGCSGDSLLFGESWDGYPAETLDKGTTGADSRTYADRRTYENQEMYEDRYESVLNNTHWRLAEIREREGGISRPDDPAKYIFTFGSDGVLLMKLNCNRARGPWTAQPNPVGRNGLAIGPLIKTHDVCEPPSLDEQIGRDMELVRSYSLEGSRLYLDLLADEGTYVLEPIEPFRDRPS